MAKVSEKQKEEVQESGLPLTQELFCRYYLEPETFMNGTKAYSKAYNKEIKDKGSYHVCATEASKLLKKPKVKAYVDKLLTDQGLTDEFVDLRLKQIIIQDEDKKVSVAAIKEYNKLKARITDKSEIAMKFKDVTDEELKEQIAEEMADLLNSTT